MSEDKLQKQSGLIKDTSVIPPEQVRRRLLKNTVAVPIIMTLSSNVAAQVARTSNLVTPIDDLDIAAKGGASGDLLCVHPGSDGSTVDERPVDLGNYPYVDTNYQNQNNLRKQAEECMEERGGILISATAYTSLSGRGVLPDSGSL